jgi:hypothetical protein
VDRLLAEGHLIRDESARSRLRVLDPFLASWLREGPAT